MAVSLSSARVAPRKSVAQLMVSLRTWSSVENVPRCRKMFLILALPLGPWLEPLLLQLIVTKTRLLRKTMSSSQKRRRKEPFTMKKEYEKEPCRHLVASIVVEAVEASWASIKMAHKSTKEKLSLVAKAGRENCTVKLYPTNHSW